MRKRLPNGLTAKEEQFAVLLCQGLPQIQAFRRAGYGKRDQDSTAAPKASALAKRPQIQARCAELLAASAVRDLDSIGRAYADLLQDLASARAEANWTAVAALQRLRLTVQGMLKDTLAVTVENSSNDTQLLDRLAAGDPAVRSALEQAIGRRGFTQH